MKYCNKTWTKYLSGPVQGKWNLIKNNAMQWNLGRAREGIRAFIQWRRRTLIRRKEKDLGVTIMVNMSPDKHTDKITGKT